MVYKFLEITKYKPHSYSVFPVNECFQELYFDKKFTLALYKKNVRKMILRVLVIYVNKIVLVIYVNKIVKTVFTTLVYRIHYVKMCIKHIFTIKIF